MLTAAAQGAKLKILFSLFAERASYDFLVSPAINSPHDLKGKKVGVQDFSGLLWSFAMLSLREIIALRDPKIAKFNVEELLDQCILTKVVKSGYVEEVERKYKLRPQ